MKEKLEKYINCDHHADIETQGLWDVVHSVENVHCLCSVVTDKDTKEDVVLLFHDRPEFDNQKVWDEEDEKYYTIPERSGSLLDGFRFWYRIGQSKHGKFFVHNSHGYDRPIIEKVLPKCKIPFEKWHDTFIQSKMQWFDRPAVKGSSGIHGLEPYGVRFGIKKPPVTNWTEFTPYICHRVIEDCHIQKKTSLYLKKENEKLLELGIDLSEATKMESRYVESCQKQEVRGAKVDIDHINKCIATFDQICTNLEEEIEPKLPPTLKPVGVRVGKKEIATLLGYKASVVNKIKEQYHVVKRNGEKITDIVKPYYKPVTNWTVKKKTNKYSGFNISHGASPPFLKKKELTDWIKKNFPDTPPKEWDIEKEIVVTELLNHHTCKFFDLEPEDVHLIGGAFTKIKFEKTTLSQHEQVKGFLIKSGIKHVEEWNLKKDDGQIVRAEEETTISYPPKASYENQIHITIPKGQPLVTSPKIGEKDYKQLKEETGKKVGEYNTTIHRRRFLSNPKDPENKGILSGVRADGRIPCGVNAFNTASSRSSHRLWVNPPSDGAMYGKEIRESIIAPARRKLVSHDMNSAQLSIAAYYANNYEYFKAVCFGQETKIDEHGNDILHPDTGKKWYIGESGHCTNMQAFGLVQPSEVQEAIRTQCEKLIHDIGLRRKKSKGATFGVIFGCSGKKLAQMLGIDEADGNARKNAFLQKIGLDRPIEILDMMCEKYRRGRGGYIELPFGYYIFCSSPHARFNYLDQGTEAACQKWAELYFDREAKRLGLDAFRILSYHDEYTVECAEDIVEDVRELMFKSYEQASIALWEWHKKHSKWFTSDDLPSFNIQLQSSSSVGNNYYEVH